MRARACLASAMSLVSSSVRSVIVAGFLRGFRGCDAGGQDRADAVAAAGAALGKELPTAFGHLSIGDRNPAEPFGHQAKDGVHALFFGIDLDVDEFSEIVDVHARHY